MMQADIKTLVTAILAAAISAGLCVGLWFNLINMPFLALVLGFFISVPVLITAFGYGTAAGAFSAVAAAFFLFFALSPAMAWVFAVFFLAPAVFAGWLLGLVQTDAQKNTLFWYPLPQMLFQLALVVAIATITLMLSILSSNDTMQYINGLTPQLMATVRESRFYSLADQAVIENLIRSELITLIASVLSIYGFLFHLGSVYFSMRLAKRLRCLNRPLDDWPTVLRMPPAAFFMFVAGWIFGLFALNDTLALCINIIISVLTAGFLVSGIAVIHKVTRDYRWRPFLLCALYTSLFTLVLAPLASFALVITGLLSTLLSLCRGNKT